MAAELDDIWIPGGALVAHSAQHTRGNHPSHVDLFDSDLGAYHLASGHIYETDGGRLAEQDLPDAFGCDFLDEESGGVSLLDFETTTTRRKSNQDLDHAISNQQHPEEEHEEPHFSPDTYHGGVQIPLSVDQHDSETRPLDSSNNAHELRTNHALVDTGSLPTSSIPTLQPASRPSSTQVSVDHATTIVVEPSHLESDLQSRSTHNLPPAARSIAARPSEDLLPRHRGSSPPPLQYAFPRASPVNVQLSTLDSATSPYRFSAAQRNTGNTSDDDQYQHVDQQDESPMTDVPHVMNFLERWHMQSELPEAGAIRVDSDRLREWRPPTDVVGNGFDDLRDIQGIHWASIETTREAARQARSMLHPPAYSRSAITDGRPRCSARQFYSFKRTFGGHRARFTHYQLRHTLAATSRNDIFYASDNKVIRTSLACPSVADTVIDLCNSSFSLNRATADCHITTIAVSPAPEFSGYVSDSVLVSGGFEGEYSLLNLNASSNEPPVEGFVTEAIDGITTHIHMLRNRRHGALAAAFCSNDRRLRLLDVGTNCWIGDFEYADQVNCAATSPDGRLRVVVGDTRDTLITDAERGTVLVSMQQHTDDAFACAWADDGRHVATGAQDGKVVVYDARNWSAPVARLDCDLGCARSLQFTKTGSSRRPGGGSSSSSAPALVVAEADDIVSIYDSRDWTSKQTIDFFGSVAGVAVLDGGRELVVANGDKTVGGLMTFERANGDDSSVQQSGTTETTAGGWRSSGGFAGGVGSSSEGSSYSSVGGSGTTTSSTSGSRMPILDRELQRRESYWETQKKRLAVGMEQLLI